MSAVQGLVPLWRGALLSEGKITGTLGPGWSQVGSRLPGLRENFLNETFSLREDLY